MTAHRHEFLDSAGKARDTSFAHPTPVELVHPLSAFSELLMVEPRPQVQVKFPYNLNPDIATVLHNHASSTDSVAKGVLTVVMNGSADNFSCLTTTDLLRYDPGQGALIRGTCAFTAGIANSTQTFGAGNDDEGFNFGFDGTAFGVQHKAHGSLEVRTLTITGVADADGGDFVITMDGDAVTVSVNANDTIAEVTAAIVAINGGFHQAGRGWHVHSTDNITVTFVSFVAEPAAGVFSFSDTDSGVTAGAFTQATTAVLGLAPTPDTWTAQTAWNVDKMDGTGPSGMTLDPTKLNVYQIGFQYLGAGAIEFSIEDIETGRWQLVHRIKYAGTAIISSMRNPSFNLGFIIKSEAVYSGGDITMITGSLAGFIEGIEGLEGIRHNAQGTKTSTGATPVNILTIHNKITFQGNINRVEVFPDVISVASEAGKTISVDIIINPTQVDGTVSYTDVDADASVMEFDIAGTTIVGGAVRETIVVSGAGVTTLDIAGTGLHLRPGDRWVFAADLSSGSDAPITVTVAWRERV